MLNDERHDAVRLELERFRAHAEVELPAIDTVTEVWGEAREERNGLELSLARLGDAIWIYGTCRDRNAPLLTTLATKLLEAAGFAALALADET
ncbi:MAG: hypothetical protein ACLP0J_01400 [Solirubrobacteraceae bacterium]|jgi:hypothetical protein